MSSRWLARGLAAGLGVTALPGAAFAAGGEALPFNQAFDTITSNLTGPTAKAVIIAAFFAGIVGVMVSHDRPWMRNVGTVVAGGALLVGIPGFLDVLGISAAEGSFDWRPGFLVASGIVTAAAIVLFFTARLLAGGPQVPEGEPTSSR
ncbi:MAG TPA: TrbC/VirB2 family protein [Thermoanaerobaculia bacterium]